MKRTPFKSKLPPPRQAKVYTGANPGTPAVAFARVAAVEREVVPLPKEKPVQHAGYMAAVRLLPCARCGWFEKGRIQFCHADEGKGLALKTDCRAGWPGCGPHDNTMGCHWVVGTSGRMPREERREFERDAGERTRARIIAAGLWPATLPRWPE